MKSIFLRAALAAALVATFAGCASVAPATAPHDIATQPARQAAATAHPLATQAALRMLARGGSPVDAAIAAQMVLGLVEPQSSGLGGGSLLMVWDERARKLAAYDGLASAPARATAGLEVDFDGRKLPAAEVARGGRSAGVPGTLAVLKLAHERHGKLAWAALFEPAIELAEQGFPMPHYLHRVLSQPGAAADHPDMAGLYFDASGKVLPAGSTVTNAPYAQTLRRLAGPAPLETWAKDVAPAIVASLQRGAHASAITQADIAAYRPRERQAVCAPFLAYSVCAMAPPSFGGIVVLQVLQMVQARMPASVDFDDAAFVHHFAEAGKLAQADRLHYVGDPDFTAVPAAALVAAPYVAARARLIDPAKAAARVEAGRVEATPAAHRVPEPVAETADATSQLAIADGEGNAVSMTTTINLNFGSRLMAGGFVLNNALTNFSAPPAAGQAGPNRMQPNKRPVTSMAPVIVFDAAGRPVVVGGSAGGGQIVDYIAQSLVEMLANGRTPAQALAQGHVSTALRGKLQLEEGTPRATLANALKAQGHDVVLAPLPSGIGFLQRTQQGWIGAADPRRDGVAAGQ